MSNSAILALLFVAGMLTPGAALGQGAIELAMAGPQPHFVAAWAPKKEREAERSAVLAGRVSLELRDVSLDAALKALTNQAGLRITYSRAMLPAGKRVTISARDVAVVTAMTEMLFRSGLDVVVDRDGSLALVPCRHPVVETEAQDSGVIVGRVTDKATGVAIAGATVVVDGVGRGTKTDAEGRYRILNVGVGTYTVRARFIGYAALAAQATVSARDEVTANFALVKSVQVLQEVVTTGTIVPTEVKALATPITVVSDSDIVLHRPSTVQELFRQAVPGALSWNQAARPASTSFSVRGASTLNPGDNQMKVFVDGIEVVNPGSTQIDPRSIERMEVIRGPQAATIYGSDAIGGVIQIRTKRGDPSATRPLVHAQAALGAVQTPYGGYGSVLQQSYIASVRSSISDMSYHIGGGYSRTADYLPNGEESAQSNPSIHGGMRYERGILAIDLSGRYNVQNNPDVFNPDILQTGFQYYSKPLYTSSQLVNQTVGIRLSLTPVGSWQHTLTTGVDRFTNDKAQSQPRLITPGDTLLSVSALTQVKRSVAYNTSVLGSLGSGLSGSITLGIDHWNLPDTRFFADATLNTTGSIQVGEGGSIAASRLVTTNTGYFAQGQLGFRDALFLTGGVRAEQNTQFGDSLGTPVSPRVGVSYLHELRGTTLKIRSSWGRAIRPPDPGIKLALSPVIRPNSEIGPERQQGWDVGVDATFGARGSLSVTYYRQTADNLVQFVHVQDEPVPVDQFQNVGCVKNTGVEVEGSLALGTVRLKANYAYTRARVEELGPNYTGDLQVGDQVRVTPKHTAGVLLTTAPLAGTTVAAGLAYVGNFTQTDILALFRCVGGTGPCLPSFVMQYPGFVKANATVWQKITGQVSGFVSVQNLTNNNAFEATNVLPVIGRISTLGIQFQY